MPDSHTVITILSNNGVPNNKLPLLIYSQVFRPNITTAEAKAHLKANNWFNFWVGGVYNFQHYHSNTHEVLVCLSGQADVLLGGPSGHTHTILPGHVIIIPAGYGHRCMRHSADFSVLGAYPRGTSPDMSYPNEEPQTSVIDKIIKVPIPSTDPFYGSTGGLTQYWHSQN